MDEHKETSKERASDCVATEDGKTRIFESTASDVEIDSVVVATSRERSSDRVASGVCDKTRIVDSTTCDAQVGSAGMDGSEESAREHLAFGEFENTQTLDSASTDIQDRSAVTGLSEETASDLVVNGDCEKTRNVDSAASDVQDGSAVMEIWKETANDHVVSGECEITPTVSDVQTDIGVVETSKETATDLVAGGDCEKNRIFDSTAGDIQICSSVVKTWKETVNDHVASKDSEKTHTAESAASDIHILVKDASKGYSTERRDAEEGGSHCEADVSVGVMPFDVDVAGVSARDTDDDGGGMLSKNGNRNPGESKRVGSQRDTKDLIVRSEEAGDSISSFNTKSNIEALEARSEGGVEKSGEIAESKEEILGDVHTTNTEATDVGVKDAQNMVGDGVVEVSASEEIQVVPEENMTATASKKELEGKLRNEYVERGGFNAVVDLNSSETRLPKNKLHVERVENGETQASAVSKSKQADEDITYVEDSQSSRERSQLVVAGGDVATENKMPCNSCQVNSIVELEKGVNNQETYNEKAGVQKERGELETSSVDIDLNSMLGNPVVNGEVAEIDDTIPSDPKLEVPVIVSRKNQELRLEESFDRIVGGRRISVSNSNSGLEVPKEGDYHLKFERLNGNKTAINKIFADAEVVDFHQEQKMEGEQDSDSEEHETTEDKPSSQAAASEISVKPNEVTYQLPPDNEGEFDVADLVWGKVRSHPWWPGQIFHPSDASEKAMKYQKKDCFLVAYFGDRTFAWNDASLLKPFRSHFSQVEKQSNSETFHNAVNCALEEVSRRVEFGLACSCIPEDIYNKIKHQMVENAGIRQESSIQIVMEKSLSADLFEPCKLVGYMKALAQSPAGGADRLQIAVAKSQLLAFHRLRGYSELPEIQFCGDLLENDDTSQIKDELMADKPAFHKNNVKISPDQQNVQTQIGSYHKRKHNLKDSLNHKKKERSRTIGDSWDSIDDEFGSDWKTSNKLLSHSSGKKQRGLDSLADESEGTKTISLAKTSTVPVPKPSFKIGECIRRVASRMTAAPSILKSNTQKIDESRDGVVADESDALFQHSEDTEMKSLDIPTDYSSLDELLSQLHLAALDPFKGYSFSTVIVSFFSDFRNAAIMEQRERVLGKKRLQSTDGSPETFEFEDMNDTYWTDRVIQNGSEEQPPRKSRKRDTQLASGDPEKPLNKSNSRKRNSDSNHQGLVAEKPVGYVDENAPAELVMHFPVADSVPSESRLIKMFKRFGPLKEIETEIDRDTNRARVVFKKCSDAESAYSSATKFNIFGSMLVNYQLNYTVTVPFKTEPLAALQGEEDAAAFLQF